MFSSYIIRIDLVSQVTVERGRAFPVGTAERPAWPLGSEGSPWPPLSAGRAVEVFVAVIGVPANLGAQVETRRACSPPNVP